MGKVVSFASKDTRKASGLPSDFDATIVAAEFTREAPDGYPAQGNPLFAKISYLRRDIEGTDEERTLVQSYGLGGKAGDEFTVSEDGYTLTPSDDSITGLREGCKFELWMRAAEKAKVPAEILEQGSLKPLIGLDGHWRRVEDAKLLGKERTFKDDDRSKSKKFPPETLVMVQLHALPAIKATTKTTKATATPPAVDAADLDTRTSEFLMKVLANAKDNQLQRAVLLGHLAKAAKAAGAADSMAIAKRGGEEAFLLAQAEAGLIAYDQSAEPQIVRLAA